ncbi:MurR/RpiR family transcriptional regulator [Erysipelothrix sp. HDW6C]|uniref:MurR/RpiR family transcriptional regulator n=1 Tax=Erysipelothrix sp. HDW6C TaxID=2714930 RepID=UPI0014077356|nr:MurR/RpiR family transcriptional regulator [Erysipelothrix sp. HDW6C]QIK69406.1 MurR/RpiR family transcriptional regulator [Erysipelothrix sp. HDW6C]
MVYSKLQSKDGLSSVQGHIADYVLAHTDRVLTISIHELAASTNTSIATVTRFCKKLGVDGYRDFQISLLRSLNVHMMVTEEQIPLNENSNELELVDSIGSLQKRAITSTQLLLTTELLSGTIDAINKAENLYGVGISDSFISLHDFQNKLLKVSKFVRIAFLQPEQTFLCAQATPRDVAFVISYGGKSAEVVNACKILKKRGAIIIALTSDEKSPVGRLATRILPLPPIDEEDELIRITFSYAAISYAINLIYAGLYRNNYAKNQDYIVKVKDEYLNK